MKIKLDGVMETLLITLNFKAKDCSSTNPILNDKKAQEICSKIDYDFSKFDKAWMRYYLKENEIKNLGKVILISPPSHGSQLSDNPLTNILKYFLGKAPIDLKTDKDSFVNSLEEPNYKTYILIGNKSNNFLYSLFIKGIDDGMVPLDGANLKDADFEIIDATTHTSILKDERTLDKINKILKQ